MDCVLREAFNPDILSFMFRYYLLSVDNFYFNMKLDLTTKPLQHGEVDGSEEMKTNKLIEELIKDDLDDRSKWRCLLAAPPRALIRSHAFWKYLSRDFFKEICSLAPLKALEEQEGKSTLALLHTIMNTYFDSIRLLFNAEYDVNYSYFWSKLYSSFP